MGKGFERYLRVVPQVACNAVFLSFFIHNHLMVNKLHYNTIKTHSNPRVQTVLSGDAPSATPNVYPLGN